MHTDYVFYFSYSPCSARYWHTLESKLHKNMHCFTQLVHHGHVQLWELDHKEGRTPKDWCLRTVVLEKTSGSPLDKIKPVNLKGDQPWIFTGRIDAEAETPIFWSSDMNRWLTGKAPDAGKDWEGRRRRGCQRMRWLDSIATLTQSTWANSRRWWGTGRPGKLQSMGSQRVGLNWATQQQRQQTSSTCQALCWAPG